MNNPITIASLLCELRENIAANKYALPWDPGAQARAAFVIDELARRGRPDDQIDALIEQGNLDALKRASDEQLLNEVRIASSFFVFAGVSLRDICNRERIIDELLLRGCSVDDISAALHKGNEEGKQIAAEMSAETSEKITGFEGPETF